MRFVALLCCFAMLSLVILGCGGSDANLAGVSGKVTMDGQPLSGATVEFQPAGPGGSPSYGTTDASGAYELMFTYDKKGATPGEHTVRISKVEGGTEGEEAPVEPTPEGEEVAGKQLVPTKYNSETTLKATVKEGKNTIDFALTSS